MKRIALSLVLIAVAAVATVADGQPFDLSIDHIMQGPALIGWSPADIRWSPDSSHVYFSWKQRGDSLEKDRDTWVVNRDGGGLRKLSEKEAKDAPPAGGQWTRDRASAVYAEDGDLYLWESKTGVRRALTQTTDAESAPRFTFDENAVTFVRANNLFALSLRDGEVRQLTNIVSLDDKGPNVTLWDDKKGSESQESLKKEERTLLNVIDRRARKREEEEARRKREHPLKPYKLEKKQTLVDGQLTPDGRYVVAVMATESEKAKKAIVPNYITEAAYTDTIPSREKVGDASTPSRLALFNAGTGEVKWFEHGMKAVAPPERTEKALTASPIEKEGRGSEEKTEKSGAAGAKEREVSLGLPLWSEDGKHAFVTVRSYDNKDVWLMAFDPAAAKGRVLAAMHDDAWIRFSQFEPSSGWLRDSATIYHASEATGFMHLYEVPWAGGVSRALTSGNWEVDSIALDRSGKNFYLTTSDGSPFERHLERLPVSGGPLEKITSVPGNHEAVVAPDASAIADLYSYTNKPPELYLADSKRGAAPVRVTHSPSPEFEAYPWLDVPIVQIPARDGVEVPARLYKPANWQPGGKAVVFVHGAGYLQNVHRWWSSYSHEYMFHHLLMSKGYLVLDADYRGSKGYGRDWRTAIYRHMGGKDLDDQVDAARWLVSTQGVDAKKIGVYGGSYGGFITLMAMFTQPEVFAAGAALRPVTDWAHYNHGYTANILNLPQTDSEAYRRSSPIYFANGLKGRLLICHGMVDTNVHFQDTVRLVQRLIELRKTGWDLAVYPVENHGFVEPTSWADEYMRIFQLFEETLR